MEKQTVLTNEGLAKLNEELILLKTITRKEVAERLKIARGYGDLSENSEYDEAKNEQAKVEARILELETIITKAKVVNRSDINSGAVGIGSHVLLLDTEYNEELNVCLVGSSESDPDGNRISNESPIGEAILGRKVGETIEAVTPSGTLKFKILKILD